MKKILIHLGIFLAAIIAADRVGTYFFTRYIFSAAISGDSGGAVNYLLQKKKNADFIIMGSSRAKHHINPDLLTNVFNGNGYNAGADGTGGIVYNDMLLHLLLNNAVKPKLVILQLDPYPYFTDTDEDIANELLPLYPFLSNCEAFQLFTNEHTGYAEKFKLLFHSYRYNGRFFRVLYNYIKRKSITDNNGFEALEGQLDSSSFKMPGDLNQPHSLSVIRMKTLNDFVQTCKINNISLAVVFPPSYKNSALEKPVFDSIITLLQKSGVQNIYNFSAIEKTPSLQTAGVWKDARHLNSKGAILFSGILNNAMKGIK